MAHTPGSNDRRGKTASGSVPDRTDPSGSARQTDRLTVLAHELNNMLDGSMRWLELATRTLPAEVGEAEAEQIGRVRSQLETVQGTLGRMATIVQAALRAGAVPGGSPLLAAGGRITLGEAIDHAVDVVRPLASEQAVEFELRLEREAGLASAGPLYTVVLNAVRNAVESIARRTRSDGGRGGRVVVEASVIPHRRGAERLRLVVADDGEGLAQGRDAGWAFGHGATTKQDGSGIGLAISRALVEELGGTIELRRRHDGGGAGPGAALVIECPVPRADERTFGGPGGV